MLQYNQSNEELFTTITPIRKGHISILNTCLEHRKIYRIKNENPYVILYFNLGSDIHLTDHQGDTLIVKQMHYNVVFAPQGKEFEFNLEKNKWYLLLSIKIHLEKVKDLICNKVSFKDFKVTLCKCQPKLLFEHDVPITDTLFGNINEILQCSESDKVLKQLQDARSMIMLDAIIKHYKEKSNHAHHFYTKMEHQHILNAKRIIIDNIGAKLNSSKLARHVGINRSDLFRLFKSIEGKTIEDFRTEIWINRAKFELIYTDNKVSSIATSLGFRESSAINKPFKAATGMTPSAYRTKFQKPIPTKSNTKDSMNTISTLVKGSSVILTMPKNCLAGNNLTESFNQNKGSFEICRGCSSYSGCCQSKTAND